MQDSLIFSTVHRHPVLAQHGSIDPMIVVHDNFMPFHNSLNLQMIVRALPNDPFCRCPVSTKTILLVLLVHFPPNVCH